MLVGESIPVNYVPIAIFAIIAFVFGLVTLTVGQLVRPSHPYHAKLSVYESGATVFSDARVKIPMRYYVIAMLFVIFDIEVIFLYPWAVVYDTLGVLGLVEMAVFIMILLVGYAYAWKKGVLDWDELDG
tara:strand:- start:391 stop:777 length:387 start_codon:yes stop_codon:yes gene_type:complete